MIDREVVVLGAGMVGVCSALVLQLKGLNVTLVDRHPPGTETSFGNAGIITPSSLIPINNPKLLSGLPLFLANRSAGFRYSLPYVLTQLPTLLKFLGFARENSTPQRISQLYTLIERSIELHQQWQTAASKEQITADSLRHSGWLKLYRSRKSFENAQYEFDIYRQYNIETTQYNSAQLARKAPYLKGIYQRGLLIEQALSVSNPAALVQAYTDKFIDAGGEIICSDVLDIQRTKQRWALTCADDETINCQQLILATGPWSKKLLSQVRLNLPMIFERGAHREYHYENTAPKRQHLAVPIHDVDGSFVATPIANGLRICCGVELNQQQAKYPNEQIDAAERSAREGLEFSAGYTSQWQGARPTMPDSLPLIGASKLPGLWLNTGHQHIGFSTGPASAEILASCFLSEAGAIESAAFDPARFGL